MKQNSRDLEMARILILLVAALAAVTAPNMLRNASKDCCSKVFYDNGSVNGVVYCDFERQCWPRNFDFTLCPEWRRFKHAAPREPERIIGGTVTTINEYPYAAPLLYAYNMLFFSQACGGTIITSRAVLTAAHCFILNLSAQWRIRVGSTFASSGGTVISVNSIIRHPNYSSLRGNDNDVAILRTSSAIVYSDIVQPASIAGSAYNLADNEEVWAIGWGRTTVGGLTSEQLRHVQIWTVNQAVCVSRYATVRDTVTDNMLCAGWLDVGGRDQCQGDSGGPLLHHNVVVGICSWGRSCADAFFPGVNTRVSRYTAWIQANA